jgi:hypothetical protein
MHGESNGVDLQRVAGPHTGTDEQVETASINAIRQMGWLLAKQGEAVRPLAHCMMGEPAWFTRQISYADLRALIYAAKACNNRHDTRKLMAAFLPSRMVERWCPRGQRGTTNPTDTEGAA